MTGRKTLLLAAMLFFFVLLSLVRPSSAHMVMSEPPPINYQTNPYYVVSKADFDYTAPLSPSGSNFPCRGHLKDLDTPQGQSVRTYKPGGTYSMVISGSAAHGGGSCQVALSYDKGSTWTVIISFIGNCPHAVPGGDQNFNVPIPSNAPNGLAVFAWTWFNNVGNREMYMNCAVVTISSSGSKLRPKAAFSGPSIFLANIGNGCTTAPNTDVVFPNPGSVVQYGGNAAARAAPVGSCQGTVLTSSSGNNGGDTSGGGGGGGGGDETSGTTTSVMNAATGTKTATAGGQGKTTMASTFSFVYSATLVSTSPTFIPLYPSSLKSSVAGLQTSRVHTGTAATSKVMNPVTATNTDEGDPDVQGSLGCAYWRSQGYVCSAAAPALLGQRIILHIILGFLAFSWICGFLRVF